MPTNRPIAAAGGVLWRDGPNGIEVALVHRPRYDDWTLPKGKQHRHEYELDAAVREVNEETGASVAVSRRIGRVHYLADDEPKTVVYWAMRYLGGAFTPGDEVDELSWLSASKARKRLTHDADRRILADFAAQPVADSVIILARHAHAGRRRDWVGNDALRPLDVLGVEQSLHLARTLRHFAPERIISAEPTRCVQTVAPVAALLGVPVEIDGVFGDEAFSRSRSTTHTALMALAKPGQVTIVCSQGLTIPTLIDRMGIGVRHSETKKGAAWALSVVDGDVTSADYYEPQPAH